MNMYLQYAPLITGLWLIMMALILTTNNLWSAIVFKVVPFFLGLSCLIPFIKQINGM